MTEHNFEQMRRAMVASQLRTTGVDDPRVLAAMAEVPRERFVPAEQRSIAYLDRSLHFAGGRAIPAPMVLGRLLTEARVRPTDHALVIGGGSGYAAAVLARLASRVVTLEEDASFFDDAARTTGSHQAVGPLAKGWAEAAPYDLILVDGAIEHVPDAIVAQLGEDGRIATGIVERGVTRLAIGRRAGAGFGLVPFADADVPILPGFSQPAGFRF